MEIPNGTRLFLSFKKDELTAVDKQGHTFCGRLINPNLPCDEISFPELISQLRQPIRAAKEAGADFVLAVDCLSLLHARATVFAAKKEKVPLIVCMKSNDDGLTPTGGSIVSALIALQELGILAYGITGELTPQECADVCESLTPFAKVSLLAAPTAGNPNPILPELYDLSPVKMAEAIVPILKCGVSLLLQNAGVTEEHQTALQEALFFREFSLDCLREDEEENFILANERDFFVIHDERLELTEPLSCTQDMSDELLAAEEDSVDVLRIQIDTPDDALIFAKNEHLAGLPVMFCSDDEISLKAALLLYNGRAMIDKECAIEETELEKIAAKYGSVLY